MTSIAFSFVYGVPLSDSPSAAGGVAGSGAGCSAGGVAGALPPSFEEEPPLLPPLFVEGFGFGGGGALYDTTLDAPDSRPAISTAVT